jgi:hypothetical protein
MVLNGESMMNRDNVRNPQHTHRHSEIKNRTRALLELCIVVSVDAQRPCNIRITTFQITHNVRRREDYDPPPNSIRPGNTKTFLDKITVRRGLMFKDK